MCLDLRTKQIRESKNNNKRLGDCFSAVLRAGHLAVCVCVCVCDCVGLWFAQLGCATYMWRCGLVWCVCEREIVSVCVRDCECMCERL